MTAVEIICPYCRFSKMLQREKIPLRAKWAKCPQCGQRFELILKERDVDSIEKKTDTVPESRLTEQKPEEEIGLRAAPWESRNELSLLQRLVQTVKGVLFSPENYFKNLRRTGGIKEPLAFALLVGSVGSMFGFFWQFLLVSETVLSVAKSFFGHSLSVGFIFLVVIIFIPVFVIINLFIYSGVLHVLLCIVGAGKNGFEATFRVVSYCHAAQVWVVIPFVGSWIGGIWQLVVQIIGLREIQQTSYLRVIIAFLIPVVLIILLVVAVVIILLVFTNKQMIG